MKRIKVGAMLLILSLAPVTAPSNEYGEGITARVIAKTTVTSNGQPIRYLTTDKPEVTALIIDIPPGGETGWHLHHVPVYGYVIKGTLDVEMENGDINTYREGEVFIEMMDAPHNGKNKNRGPVPVKLLAFYSGEQGTPNTLMKKPTLK